MQHHPMRPPDERERIDTIISEHSPELECLDVFATDGASPIVLIERHTRGSVWLTLHTTLDDATTYHVANEDTGWYIVGAHHVALGEVFTAETRIAWRHRRGVQTLA